jgi:cytochrome c oxidase cbb3-type subunit IV
MTYDALRHFADTWGLLAMFAIFLIAFVFALRPGAGETYARIASIPLKEDGEISHVED